MSTEKYLQDVEVLQYQDVVKHKMSNIIEDTLQDDPFYICDIGDIVQKQQIWTKYLPRVQPFYAVKCNSTLKVLQILAAMGVNFDCASEWEISEILKLGVSPERIVFANPAKPASDIKFAKNNRVSLMTFDSEDELYKIKQIYPLAKLVVRIKSDSASAMCQLGLKFGCASVKEALNLLEIAKNLEIDVVGVSFHVGSGCQDVTAYEEAIRKSHEVFDLSKKRGLFKLRLLDIGGGFPGEKNTSIKKYARVINQSIDKYFPNENDLEIIAEPGRFFMSSAFTLAAKIHAVRLENDTRIYHINDGSYGTFSILVFCDMEPVIPIPFNAGKFAPLVTSTFWGPSYDHFDLVAKNIMFPTMDVGDWVFFEDKGSYTLTLWTRFQGLEVPNIYFVIEESFVRELSKMLRNK